MTKFPAPEAIIKEWILERADAGVVRAKVVSDVSCTDGVMTVKIDPDKSIERYAWDWLNENSLDTPGEFYATEFCWTNDQSTYLREMVTELRVVDAAGNILESVDTAAFQRKSNPQI